MTLQSFERPPTQPKRFSQAWVALFSLFSVMVLSGQASAAPASVEIFAGSGGTATGPTSSTEAYQYRLNANNPTDNNNVAYTPAISVSYAITNSVYNVSTYQGGATNQPNLLFGGTIGTKQINVNGNLTTVNTNIIASSQINVPLNTLGLPPNNVFAATLQNGTTCPATGACTSTNGGINATDTASPRNHGARMSASVRGFDAAGLSTNGRHRVGQVTVTFNRPVTNPVLQVAGLGGSVSIDNNNDGDTNDAGETLGFSGEFTLVGNTTADNNNNIVLRRIAGSTELSVQGNNIVNTATAIGSNTGSGGASGSVLINGRRITSVTFDVYVRGDGRNPNEWTSDTNTDVERRGIGVETLFFGVSSVEADSDLSIVKTQRIGTSGDFVRTQILPNQLDTIQYQLVMTNGTTNALVDASFSDIVPSNITGLSIVSATPSSGASCPRTLSGNTLAGTFSGPASATCTIVLQGTASATGDITNTATILENATDPDSTNNSSGVNAIIAPSADLSITKTNGVTAVNAGSSTTYTVVVTNTGPSAANGAIFRDAAATNLTKTNITCSATNSAVCPTAASVPALITAVEAGVAIPTLPSTGTLTFAITATVNAISGQVANTATITAPAGTAEINAANNTETDTDTVTPAVDLVVVKSQRAGTTGAFQTSTLSVLVLGTVQYRLVFTNNGPSVVTDATLSDSVPAQFNTVSVVSATSANGATACSATNTGNSVSGTWSGPSGATCTVLIQARAQLTTGTYTNTATTAVPSGTVETNNANNSSSVDTVIAPAADLAIVKSQRIGTTGAFVSTALSVNQLQTVQYQLVLTNNGPTAATAATYTDTIPANITGLTVVGTPATTGIGTVCAAPTFTGQTLNGTFTAAQDGTCTVIVQGTATSTGSITNTATVTAVGVTDTVTANNSSSVDMTIALAADLSITKTNSVTAVDAGGTTAYTVVVSNAGPSSTNNAVFQDAAATGLTKTSISCTAAGGAVCPTSPTVAQVEAGLAIPTLPSGGSVTFTVNANVTATSGSVANTATVTAPAGTTEINTANNTATDTDTVTPNADLSISKTNSVSSVNAGGSTSYSVVVSNAGPSSANNAVFQDAAATGLTKTGISCTAAGGAVCPTSPTVAQVEAGLAIPTLPSGGSVTFTVNANVTATSGSVANTATVTAPAGTTEINTANNTATDTDTVTPNADLSVTKTNSVSSVSAGGSTSYSVVVSNAGPSSVNNAVFQDAAATGLTKTSISCTAAGGAVCPTSPTVAQVEAGLAIPTLPSGGSVTFTVSANVTATSGSVANTATVTAPAGTTEIDPANNTATDTDTVNGLVSISGRVFTDNSGTTAVAANAYNGLQNTGELGIAGSTVELNNCAGTVIATTQTDGAGDYAFGVQISSLSNPNFCITQTNLAGYTSVSGTAGYARTTDTISIVNSGALSYSNHNFGDARLNLILTSDGQQTTTPSGTVSYPHILRSESVLSVGTLNTISTESPTFGWTTVLYRDTNCNGTVDGGESILTGAIGQLLPNQEICVVQRVNAPANATNGAQHVATLSASYTATVQGGAVLNGSSNTRTDTTLVGTAGLDMRKQVRVVASCPSTGADNAAFVERNTAQNGDFLEYQIMYSNRSTRNLSQLTVRDVVPSSTTFQSATCQSTPSGSGCTAPVSAAANGDLAWSLTNIAPAATGSVRFCVGVPPLAEPPIR